MAKIALAQFESRINDVYSNNMKMVRMIRQASAANADIIVFPELFTTGYNLDIIGDRIMDMASGTDGDTIKLASSEAALGGIYVIAPLAFEGKDGNIYNSAAVIDDGGKLLNVYHKNNLWDREQKYFSYGNHDYRVFDTGFGKFGVIICYDVDFPETCRTLALNGAEIIFVPAAWATTHRNLWDIYLPARALENTVFVAGVNRTGKEGDVIYFGDSKAFDPTGNLIARAAEGREEILYLEIDVSDIPGIREDFPYLRELRKDY